MNAPVQQTSDSDASTARRTALDYPPLTHVSLELSPVPGIPRLYISTLGLYPILELSNAIFSPGGLAESWTSSTASTSDGAGLGAAVRPRAPTDCAGLSEYASTRPRAPKGGADAFNQACSTVTATAALLALAPAGASARATSSVHPHAVRPATSILECARRRARFVRPAMRRRSSGALRCPAATPPRRPSDHALSSSQRRRRASRRWRRRRPKPAEPSKSTPPLFMTNSMFYAVAEGAQLHARARRCASRRRSRSTAHSLEGAQLFTGGGRSLRRAQPRTFARRRQPARHRRPVVLQRENTSATEEWHPIDRSTVDAMANTRSCTPSTCRATRTFVSWCIRTRSTHRRRPRHFI